MITGKLTFAGIITSIFIFLLPYFDFAGGTVFYSTVNSKYFFILSFVAVIALIFVYKILSGKHRINLTKRWLLLMSLITLVSYYLSSFLGIDLERSLWSDILRSTGLLFITNVGLIAFVISELFSDRDWSAVFRSVIYSGTAFALLTFLGNGGLNLDGSFFTADLTKNGLTLGNETFAGAFLLIVFVVTLVEIFKSEKGSKSRKIFIIFAIVQFLSPLFISLKSIFTDFGEVISNPFVVIGFARASGVTVVLIVIFLIIYLLLKKYCGRKTKIVLRTWTIGFVVVVSIFAGMLFVPGSFVQDKYIGESTAARIIVWNNGFDSVSENPVFGWGPENFRYAHDRYFDNRLYLDENIGEVWFDRAHNIIVDTVVSVGIIGSLLTLLIWILFIRVIFKSYKNENINLYTALLFGLLPFFHFVQLQTSFDTPVTYTLIGLILGYGFWLERQFSGFKQESNNVLNKVFAVILLILVVFGIKELIFDEYDRQRSLVKIFKTVDQTEQIEFIDRGLSRSGFESLRLTTSSLIKGSLESLVGSDVENAQRKMEDALVHLNIYKRYYEEYLGDRETDYRAKMNYIYLLVIKSVFGEDELEKAGQLVRESYDLSRNNPLTYVLDSNIYLYTGDLENATERLDRAVELNPDIEFTRNVVNYLEKQKQNFPEIGILKLQNI